MFLPLLLACGHHPPPSGAPPSRGDLRACARARATGSPGGWEDYLGTFPDGACAVEATEQVVALQMPDPGDGGARGGGIALVGGSPGGGGLHTTLEVTSAGALPAADVAAAVAAAQAGLDACATTSTIMDAVTGRVPEPIAVHLTVTVTGAVGGVTLAAPAGVRPYLRRCAEEALRAVVFPGSAAPHEVDLAWDGTWPR